MGEHNPHLVCKNSDRNHQVQVPFGAVGCNSKRTNPKIFHPYRPVLRVNIKKINESMTHEWHHHPGGFGSGGSCHVDLHGRKCSKLGLVGSLNQCKTTPSWHIFFQMLGVQKRDPNVMDSNTYAGLSHTYCRGLATKKTQYKLNHN